MTPELKMLDLFLAVIDSCKTEVKIIEYQNGYIDALWEVKDRIFKLVSEEGIATITRVRLSEETRKKIGKLLSKVEDTEMVIHAFASKMELPMAEQTCENCRYWYHGRETCSCFAPEIGDIPHYGQCRKSTPKLDKNFRCTFPKMYSKDRCGEWRGK